MELLGYLLSALVGISLGLIGGGGSILMVPILVYIMGFDPIIATSYSLFIVGSTSLVGTFNNYRKQLVNTRIALLFGITSVTTVFLTRKFIIPNIPATILTINDFQLSREVAIMILFAILMLLASLAMIFTDAEKHDQKPSGSKQLQVLNLLVYGILIGLVTGLLGAGGGFLLIPVLVMLFKLPMKKAIGTSLLIIALNSLIGFIGDVGKHDIDWKQLATITLISIAGIFIGSYLSEKINGEKLKVAFGWFVLSMGVYIILKELL